MGGGVVAAAAVAANRRRLAEVIEAFRAAGATAPREAQPISDDLSGRAREIGQLADAGILVEVEDARWYLDEAAYTEWQEGRRGRVQVALTVIGVVVAIGALLALIGLWVASRRS